MEINIFWYYENSFFQHKDVSWLSVFIAFFGNFQFNGIVFIWQESILLKIICSISIVQHQ